MISENVKHLDVIRRLAVATIDQSLHSHLYFVSKDGFVNQLDLILEQLVQPSEIRAKGYRVKVNIPAPQMPLVSKKRLRI